MRHNIFFHSTPTASAPDSNGQQRQDYLSFLRLPVLSPLLSLSLDSGRLFEAAFDIDLRSVTASR